MLLFWIRLKKFLNILFLKTAKLKYRTRAHSTLPFLPAPNPGCVLLMHVQELETIRRHGVQLPVIEMTLLHYRRLIEQGYGDEDISTIFRLKDALFSG